MLDEAIEALAAGERGKAEQLLDQVVRTIWDSDRTAAVAELAGRGRRKPGRYHRRFRRRMLLSARRLQAEQPELRHQEFDVGDVLRLDTHRS